MDRFGALFVGKAVLRKVGFVVGDGMDRDLFGNPSHGGFTKAALAIG
jgi:hypothetical protein